jgi:lipopolysaccharide transport system permease protein
MLRRVAPVIADLWQHRELLWQFTVRNVELRHKGSHLGLVWSVLNPLLMLGLYVLVFGYIFSGSFYVMTNESKLDYGLGIFLSLTLYHFIAEVLGLSPSTVVTNPNFVKKVVFPLEILPAASVGGALLHMLISLSLALVGIVCFGPAVSAGILWLPVIIVPLVLLALGMAWLVSALGVFFRDIGQITQFASIALLWASAVFFTAQRYPEAWTYLRFNPLLLAISLARETVLWDRPLNPTHLAYLYACSIAVCHVGHTTFRRLKPAFADVL